MDFVTRLVRRSPKMLAEMSKLEFETVEHFSAVQTSLRNYAQQSWSDEGDDEEPRHSSSSEEGPECPPTLTSATTPAPMIQSLAIADTSSNYSPTTLTTKRCFTFSISIECFKINR